VAQAATLDRDSLVAAIDGFQMQYGTAVGNAIVLCLGGAVSGPRLDVGEMTFGNKRHGRSLDDKAKPPPSRSRRWRRARTTPPRSSC
jgi:Ca-activated chloride channel family protein